MKFTAALMLTGGALATKKESVFWLNVLAIPRKPQVVNDLNTLQMAFRSRIKLFYRPINLPGTPDEAIGEVQWELVRSRSGQGFALLAFNPSAFNVSLVDLELVYGSQREQSEDGMVGPGEIRLFLLPTLRARPSFGARVEFNAIDDYGALVRTRQALRRYFLSDAFTRDSMMSISSTSSRSEGTASICLEPARNLDS